MTLPNFLDALDRLHLLTECYEMETRRELGGTCRQLSATVATSFRGEIELVANYALATDRSCRQTRYPIRAALEVALADAFGDLRSEIRSTDRNPD